MGEGVGRRPGMRSVVRWRHWVRQVGLMILGTAVSWEESRGSEGMGD